MLVSDFCREWRYDNSRADKNPHGHLLQATKKALTLIKAFFMNVSVS